MYRLTRVTKLERSCVAVADTREELRDIVFDTLENNNDKVLVTENDTMSWVWESQGIDHYYITGGSV